MENHKMTLMGLFVAAGLVLAWFLGLFEGVDPAIAEAQNYRDTKMKAVFNLPQEERRSVFEGLRDRVEKLSESQRKEFFQQTMFKFVRQLQEMPPEERNETLDKFIDRMEKARAEGRGPGGGSGRPNMSAEDIDKRRKKMLDSTTPQMRGVMDSMLDMINDRREARGLEPIQGPPFGRPPR